STATSSVYLERGVTDIRLGMTLELATTIGAAIAAVVAGYINRRTLALMFAIFLFYSAASLVRRAWRARNEMLQTEVPEYTVRRYPLGLATALVAGGFIGLVEHGRGPKNQGIMFLLNDLPLKVATATSNFRIGLTDDTNAYVY